VVWLVQLKFPGSTTRGAAPDGWVTTALAEDKHTAAREAAQLFYHCTHPVSGDTAHLLRIRSEEQVTTIDGPEALADASQSFRDFAELVAASPP
jgi:hypothetical protein